jgi:hypothetical protein
MTYRIIIAIYGCVTEPVYKEQITKINNTWANQSNEQVKIIYFLGEEPSADFTGDTYVYLPGVRNDYLSASYKQNLGLKYIYENYKTDFVLCCGTDTFLNIPKLLGFLDQFNPNDNLYIGGHGCYRLIGNESYYFHSGGPGFVLTYDCLQKIYPFCDNLTETWIDICKNNNTEVLSSCCDVAISYFLQTYVNVEVVKTNDPLFIHCNYRGYPCHINQINMADIISCHTMSLHDFDEFYDILQKNNFFITNT